MSTFVTEEEKTWGMAVHLSAFASFLFPIVGSILGPLIIWLIKKDSMPFVDKQGREAINFNISIFIYLVISVILKILLVGFLLIGVVFIFWFVMVIIATVKAAKGQHYRYPLTIRFL